MKRCKICGVIMSMFHSTLVGNCSARLKKLKMEDFYDYEILEMAMDNTYNLIMGDSTLQDFLNAGQDFMPFLCDPYNPSKKILKIF